MQQVKTCPICGNNNDPLYLKCACGCNLMDILPTYLEEVEEKEKNENNENLEIKLINDLDGFEIIICSKAAIIGKEGDTCCEYFQKSRFISRKHAEINYKTDGHYLIDKNSTNGTILNNTNLEPEKEYKIKSGDTITFADLKFRII